MKKLLIGLFTALLVAGFAGCANPEANKDEKTVTRVKASGKIGQYEKPYEVGDIVFKDGSATPYKSGMTLTDTQKTSAIALIFYKGTGLNSDDSNTSRTLGVGLKQDTSVWCTYSAAACNINITTIQCPDSDNNGALTFTGDKNGSDNLEQISAFLTAAEGVVDDTATEDKYSAFYFAKNYKNVTGSNVNTTSYQNGWYLPSIAELYQIHANGIGSNKAFDLNAAIETLGGDKFIDGDYWSSSQVFLNNNQGLNNNDVASYACRLNFKQCYVKVGGKDGNNRFCCIRIFN